MTRKGPVAELLERFGIPAVELDEPTASSAGHVPVSPDPTFASFFATAVPESRSDAATRPGAPTPLPSDVDGYEVLTQLGLGGMGRVLEARDPELGRAVALKMALPGKERERRLARFVTEARVTAQLDHPSIVPVYAIGIDPTDGAVYYSMKRVVGRSLRQTLSELRGEGGNRGPWTPRGLLGAFVQVCNAVAYAHDRGVLHRDLKPDNLMLGDYGEVYVMDWGLARVLNQDADREPDPPLEELDSRESDFVTTADGGSVHGTLAGSVIGTPGYMAPEQALGDRSKVGIRSDVWSLGAILYEVLTLTRAYPARSPEQIAWSVLSGPPEDPRQRAPDRDIPAEIAHVCRIALAREPSDRWPSAAALGDAVRGFLEGRRRKEEAALHLAEAEVAWRRRERLIAERDALQERERALAATFEPWSPMEERSELIAMRGRLARSRVDIAMGFGEVVTACEQALAEDPDNAEARAALARAWWDRTLSAEAHDDDAQVAFCADRVRQYDDGSYAEQLQGTGAVSLVTDPPGAEVTCRQFIPEGIVWPLGEPASLGSTPLQELPLGMGSWLLTLRLPGFAEVRYPVHIGRGAHWDGGPSPVRMLRSAEGDEDWCYVPAGPFVAGGDSEALEARDAVVRTLDGFLISRFPVTMGEYCAFINAVAAEQGVDAALARVPRGESGVKAESGAHYWMKPEPGQPFVVPEVDRDGDRWDPAWPVLAINWHDAMAYARWRSVSDGVPCSLPSEDQWEKAARGVDGRAYPWGDPFDATLARIRYSVAGRPQPERVGAYPGDVSVYGVRDLAGTIRELTCDPSFDGDVQRRVVKGASWNHLPDAARGASRLGTSHWNVGAFHGFRLVRAVPEES